MTREEAFEKAHDAVFAFMRGFSRRMSNEEMFQAARIILRPVPTKGRPVTPTRLAQYMRKVDRYALRYAKYVNCCENEWLHNA